MVLVGDGLRQRDDERRTGQGTCTTTAASVQVTVRKGQCTVGFNVHARDKMRLAFFVIRCQFDVVNGGRGREKLSRLFVGLIFVLIVRGSGTVRLRCCDRFVDV